MAGKPLDRRTFLRTCALLGGASLLAACGSSPAAAPAGSGASSSPPSSAGAPSAAPASKPAASPAASPSAAGAASAAAKPGSLRKVNYGTTGAGFNPFIAMDQGFLAEQGIEVNLVRFDSAANMIPALGAGQLDVGSGAIGAGLWNAVARGVNVSVVADGGHSDATPPGFPQQELLVRKALFDSGKVKSVSDLKGMKTGMSVRGTSVEYAIVKMLEKGGLTVKDVDAIEMPPTEFAVAMANGKVDAVFGIQPSVTTLLGDGTAAHLMYDYEAVPNNQSLALIYGPQFAASDLAVPFMIGYLKGVRVYEDAFQKRDADARNRAFDAVVKYGPVKDRSVYEKQTSFFLVDPDGKINLKGLQDQQDFFLSTGTQTSRVDFSKIVDTHFAEQAAARLGPYK